MPRTDKDLKRQWFRRAYINGDVKRNVPKKQEEEIEETPRDVIDIIPVKPVGRPHDVPNHNRYHSPPREGAEAFKKNSRVAWVDQYYVEEKPGQQPGDGKRNWTADGVPPPTRAQSGRGYSAPGSRPRRDSHVRRSSPARGRGHRGSSPTYLNDKGSKRNTPDRRDGPYSPRRFLYTPPGRGNGRSPSKPQRTRSSADIFQPRSRRTDGRNARTPSPRRASGRDPYRATTEGRTGRLSPSLPYTTGGRRTRGAAHGRVSSAPKYGRSMSHPRGAPRAARSADAHGRSPVGLKPALHGKRKRTQKQRMVKGGSKKTPHNRPTPWRPVGDPTARQYRTRPDNYASGTMISN